MCIVSGGFTNILSLNRLLETRDCLGIVFPDTLTPEIMNARLKNRIVVTCGSTLLKPVKCPL